MLGNCMSAVPFSVATISLTRMFDCTIANCIAKDHESYFVPKELKLPLIPLLLPIHRSYGTNLIASYFLTLL